MSEKQEILESIKALHESIKQKDIARDAARDLFWEMRTQELEDVIKKIKVVAIDIELIKNDRILIASAIADIKDIKTSVARYVAVEKFIETSSKFSIGVFKVFIGVGAIGGAIWGACKIIYHYINYTK